MTLEDALKRSLITLHHSKALGYMSDADKAFKQGNKSLALVLNLAAEEQIEEAEKLAKGLAS